MVHDEGESSVLFSVEQGFHQWYIRAVMQFNIVLAAVIQVTFTRSEANKDVMDALASLRKKEEAKGGWRKQRT